MSSLIAAAVPTTVRSIIYLGMDVHKDAITIAVLPQGAKTPTRLERLPNDLPKLKKWLDRVAREGDVPACYEASGAGYVLHRALRDWGYACEVIAPALIPKRSGGHRKHDKRDAADLARLYRAGELVPVRIPSEADERVRDVVRCRETFQREILKSRPLHPEVPGDARVRVARGNELVHTAPPVAPAPDDGGLAARDGGPSRVPRVSRPLDVQAAAARGARPAD
jgi:hypothetical protein